MFLVGKSLILLLHITESLGAFRDNIFLYWDHHASPCKTDTAHRRAWLTLKLDT